MTGAETCNQHAPVPHHTYTIRGRDRMARRESISLSREEHQRLMARVQVDPASGCWNWTGPLSSRGYASATVRSRGRFVHRLFYEAVKGPIPAELCIDHLCRNRACVNPDHLEAATNRENLLRGDTLPARYAAATHCRSGHEYTPKTTRIKVEEYGVVRCCRTCERQWCAKWEARLAARGVSRSAYRAMLRQWKAAQRA